MVMNYVHAADHANNIAANGPNVDAVARKRWGGNRLMRGMKSWKKKLKKSGCNKNEIEKREPALTKMK